MACVRSTSMGPPRPSSVRRSCFCALPQRDPIELDKSAWSSVSLSFRGSFFVCGWARAGIAGALLAIFEAMDATAASAIGRNASEWSEKKCPTMLQVGVNTWSCCLTTCAQPMTKRAPDAICYRTDVRNRQMRRLPSSLCQTHTRDRQRQRPKSKKNGGPITGKARPRPP